MILSTIENSPIVWGIVGANHGSALCVYDSYTHEVLFASKSERFSETKNDPDLSFEMQEWALKEFGTPSKILFHERKWLKQLRRIYAKQSIPFKANVDTLIPELKKVSQTTYGHHLSHVANGFHTSNFSSAIVVCVDAIGEFDTLSVWLCDRNSKKCVYRILYPNSVGLFYSAMTKAAGLKPGEEEFMLMSASALPFGGRVLTPTDFADIPMIVQSNDWPVWKTSWNWHHSVPDYLLNKYLNIHDYAATAQYLVTTYVKEIIRTAKLKYGGFSNNLVLTGGVFMNCVLNSTIANSKLFGRIHIPVDPSDSGSCVGITMLYSNSFHSVSPYLGINQPTINTSILTKELLDTGLAGVVSGKAEFGDRALGNRSILGVPTKEIKTKLNALKGRETYRPFAPVIREEDFDRYFQRIPGIDTSMMQYTVRAKPQAYESLTQVMHIDKASRVQTVNKNNYLHAVLTDLETNGRHPVLINTSFNLRGQPMVNLLSKAMQLSPHLPVIDDSDLNKAFFYNQL